MLWAEEGTKAGDTSAQPHSGRSIWEPVSPTLPVNLCRCWGSLSGGYCPQFRAGFPLGSDTPGLHLVHRASASAKTDVMSRFSAVSNEPFRVSLLLSASSVPLWERCPLNLPYLWQTCIYIFQDASLGQWRWFILCGMCLFSKWRMFLCLFFNTFIVNYVFPT